MKSLTICMVLCTLSLSNVVAGLPDGTQKELADLIQIQDDRVRAFQVKYRLTQGEYTENGELVSDVMIDCEFGHDLAKGHRYLHEKWGNHSSGDDLEREYTYHGKRGMSLTLKQPGDPGRTYGRIMPEQPKTSPHQWPGTAACSYIPWIA